MALYEEVRLALAKRSMMGQRSSWRVMRDAVVVRIGNVTNYYATEIKSDAAARKQFGRVTPPFPVMWLETPAAEWFVGEKASGPWPKHFFQQAGALIERTEWPEGKPEARWHVRARFIFSLPLFPLPADSQYLPYPMCTADFDLDFDGHIIGENIEYDQLFPFANRRLDGLLHELLTVNESLFIDILVLSLSFMNCRNVVLEETVPVAPVPTKKQRRLHEEPRAEHRFHTIVITPFKPRKATVKVGEVEASAEGGDEDDEEETRQEQPLHIVRGTVHTYTAEHPLFGIPGMVGQFVIREHTRGKVESGFLHTDYEISLARPGERRKAKSET